MARALMLLGTKRAWVVHGADGIDELSPAGPNLVAEVVEGEVIERVIDPLELGIPRCSPKDLLGGSPEENASAIRRVFAGEDGGARDAILLNAAGAIAAGGHADDLRDGIGLARDAVASGAAAERLDALVAFSRGNGPVQ
jgi:anthranilate phosphoribosyltransferase